MKLELGNRFKYQIKKSKLLHLIFFILFTASSVLSQRVNQLTASEVEEIEQCLGYNIKRIYLQLDDNGRLLRGYKPRYYSEIRADYKPQQKTYKFEIISNSNPSLNQMKFKSCLNELFIANRQKVKYIIEIEFDIEIAIPNRIAEIENGMNSFANNYIEHFIKPDLWQMRYEANYLRNASKEIQTEVKNEFEKSSIKIINTYLTKFNQDSLSENRLDFKNFNSIWNSFETEIDESLVEIINLNR